MQRPVSVKNGKNPFQFCVHNHGLLDKFVFYSRDREWTFPTGNRLLVVIDSFPECGVTLCDPVFDLVVKCDGLDKDLLRFGLGRYVGEGIVDSISLAPTGLQVVGILVSGFSQHKFRAF